MLARIRHILGQLGQQSPLAVVLLGTVFLALHQEAQRVSLPPPPRHVYTVTQVLDGLRAHPTAWLGRTIWVRGLWFDLCGYYVDPSTLGPNQLNTSGCVLPSPGYPDNGLADSPSLGGSGDRILATRVSGQTDGWFRGGPLGLADGIPAYYTITLRMDAPCTNSDGGPSMADNPPPGTPSCPVGIVGKAML